MAAGESQIECRKCNEQVTVESGSCPHCGTKIRSTISLAAVGVVGAALAGGSLLDLGSLWFFFLIGLAMIGVAGALLYDRRQRRYNVSSH